jgi:hypothetical protein
MWSDTIKYDLKTHCNVLFRLPDAKNIFVFANVGLKIVMTSGEHGRFTSSLHFLMFLKIHIFKPDTDCLSASLQIPFQEFSNLVSLFPQTVSQNRTTKAQFTICI